ncbi:MAG: hypothetical protein V3T31_13715 [candidate division Zixibacteria bacterium]
MYRNLLTFALAISILAGCSDSGSLEQLRQDGLDAFAEEEYSDARAYFSEGLKQLPSDRDFLYYIGVSYKRDYMFDSAMVFLKRSALFHKSDREVNLALLEVAMALEAWDEALSAIGGLTAAGDTEEMHYLTLATLFGKMEYPLNQFTYLYRYLILHPEDSTHYITAANLSMTVDSTHLGVALMDSAIAYFGELPKYVGTRAMIFARRGEYATAELILRDMLVADSTSIGSRMNLAHVLAAQPSKAKKREAIELFRQLKDVASGVAPLDSFIVELETELKNWNR